MPSHTPAQAFFEDEWAPARQAKTAGAARLSPASVKTYAWQWKSWCDFLLDQGVRWNSAKPQHVRQFLSNLQGSKVRRVRLPAQSAPQPVRAQASGVSRMRYARALDDIYSIAVLAGHCPANPVPAHAAPAQRGESLVLTPRDWQLLVDGVQPGGEPTWMALRDAAVLLVMLQAGLTVGELRRLDLGDVIAPHPGSRDPAARWRQAALAFSPQAAVRLSVRADEPQVPTARATARQRNQPRQVPLEPRSAAALSQWMALRVALPGAPIKPDSPLFCSRKGYGRLSAKSLFLLASQHITATLAAHFKHGRALPHAGPSTLRNSCISRWLQLFDDETVVKLAGVQDSAALARLRSVPVAAAHKASKIMERNIR